MQASVGITHFFSKAQLWLPEKKLVNDKLHYTELNRT